MATDNCLGSIGGFWPFYTVNWPRSYSTRKRLWPHVKALEHLQLPTERRNHSHAGGRGRQTDWLPGGRIAKGIKGRVRVLVANPPNMGQQGRCGQGRFFF